MKVTEEQVAAVKLVVEKSGIEMLRLQEDVLDHLCCVIEYKMKQGTEFEVALNEAVGELAPDGLAEIQRETTFLLNSNRILLMKKITYAIGLTSSMSFMTGWLFGFLHLPGGMELSVGGLFAFGMVFVPLLAFDYFKVPIQRALPEKAMVIAGVISMALIASAGIFKVMHLSGADNVLFLGSVWFIVIFLPLFFFKLYRRSVANG